MNGPAGAGKSAIARSIVELCLEQDIVVARFFFNRTDSSRNHLERLVPTLAYQLIQQIPELDAIITPKIQSHPLVFKETLEAQFQTLIFEPLLQLHSESPFQKALVLLFDGVDECRGDDNQAKLIPAIIRFVERKSFPLIVLFSSRAENQIKAEFSPSRVAKITIQIPLDDRYLPNEDIFLFLNDGFSTIKESHPFNHLFDPDWPEPEIVQEIVKKSSGQFIYASVVMKFISMPRLHPAQQLDIVRGLRVPGSLTPFAQLDALYRHIFSEIHEIEHVMFILAARILTFSPLDMNELEEMLGIRAISIYTVFADLTSVISCDAEGIHFLHASLPDFLLDQTCSQKYHIDRTLWCTQISIALHRNPWRFLKGGPDYAFASEFLRDAELTPDLRATLLAVPIGVNMPKHPLLIGVLPYFRQLKRWDSGDEGSVYCHQIKFLAQSFLPKSECFPIFLLIMAPKLVANDQICWDIMAQIKYEAMRQLKEERPDERKYNGITMIETLSILEQKFRDLTERTTSNPQVSQGQDQQDSQDLLVSASGFSEALLRNMGNLMECTNYQDFLAQFRRELEVYIIQQWKCMEELLGVD